MKYKTLGRKTGLRISEWALGTGNFGTAWGHGSDAEEAKAIFNGFVDAGGNFIDTADTYQGGQSETMIADFIAADRDYFVLSSKYTFNHVRNAGLSYTGNSRKNMVRSVEQSLKRLKTDRIDLYWAHIADGATPIEEILRGFDDLVRSGKILYAGLSNFPAWMVSRAATIADLRGWNPLSAIQVEYSLVERSAERELIPMAEALGLGVTLWSPLGGGLLTGKYRKGEKGRLEAFGGTLIHIEKSGRETAILDALEEIGRETGFTPLQVALSWVNAKSAASSTSLVPIIGPRTKAQLDGNLAALSLSLDTVQLERLDKVSGIEMGVPYRIIASSRDLITGGQSALLQPLALPVS